MAARPPGYPVLPAERRLEPAELRLDAGFATGPKSGKSKTEIPWKGTQAHQIPTCCELKQWVCVGLKARDATERLNMR
jgi:hypothetical protein